MTSISDIDTRDHRALNQDAVVEAVQAIVDISHEIIDGEKMDCRLRFKRGDWLVHLMTLLDHGEFTEVIEEISLSMSCARQEMWVCRRIPPEKRRPDAMGWTAHRYLAGQTSDVIDIVNQEADKRAKNDAPPLTSDEVHGIVESHFPQEPETVDFTTQTMVQYVSALVRRDHPAIFRRLGETKTTTVVEAILRYSSEYRRAKGEEVDQDSDR